MAVLNKLRNSTWVLIVVLVSLILFVVSDYFSSNTRLNSGGSQEVGEIAGNSISLVEFDAKYKELLMQLTQGGSEENDATREQASNYAWNQFIQSLIINKEYDKLGLDVSKEESAMLLYSDNAHATIKQYFSRDGQFSPSNVINFVNQVAKKDPKMMAQFEMIVKQIILEVQSRKYNSLVAKSIYATTLDAEDDYFSANTSYSGKSVTLNFASIEDKTIKVEESDLKDYISKHKDEFKQKASRDLEYVLLSITPTQEDTLAVEEDLASEIPAFAAAEDDSSYVNLNSSEPFRSEYIRRGALAKSIENKVFTAPKDSVVGPLYDNGSYSLFKVIDRKTDSIFHFHVIKADIPVKGTTKQDTLDAIAAGKKLAAASNSAADALEFFNSKTGSGEVTYAQDLGWQAEGSQSEEINDAVKTLSAGQSTVVKSIFGLSIIKMVEPKSYERILLAEVKRPVQALKSTSDNAYQKISNFRSALSSGKTGEFESTAKKMGFVKSVANNVKQEDRSMTGIPGTGEVVRWAFNEDRSEGDYSDIISTNDLLIVARLARIKEEGTAEVDDVREKVTRLVLNEKKAEILSKKLEEAAKSGKSIDEVAVAVKSVAQPFFNLNFYANSVQFAGNDPKLVGVVAGLKEKQISKPVVSLEGVHLFVVESSSKAELPKDLVSRKSMIYGQKRQQVYNSVFEALKKAADVKDERYKFY